MSLRRWIYLAVVAALVLGALLLVRMHVAAARDASGDAEAGRLLAQAWCTECHSVQRETAGTGQFAPDVGSIRSEVRRLAVRARPRRTRGSKRTSVRRRADRGGEQLGAPQLEKALRAKAAGDVLLAQIARMASEMGWRVGNCDVTLAARRPRVAPRVEEMRRNLAEAR